MSRTVKKTRVRKRGPKFVPPSPTIEPSDRAKAITEETKPSTFKNPRIESIWVGVKYYAVGLFDAVGEDNCFTYAAAIAFNLLMSIIPLALLLFEAFSIFLSENTHVIKIVVRTVTRTIPVENYRNAARELITGLLDKSSEASSVAGILGVISLIWLGSSLFSTLRTTTNAIFRIKGEGSTILLMARDFLLMAVLMLLFLGSTLLFPLTRGAITLSASILPDEVVLAAQSVVPYLISLGVSLIMYCVIYWILPYKQLPRKVIILCSVVTTVLVEIMKIVFGIAMEASSSIGTMYGTYAFLVAIALWVYYVAAVITISCEIGRLYWAKLEPPLPVFAKQ